MGRTRILNWALTITLDHLTAAFHDTVAKHGRLSTAGPEILNSSHGWWMNDGSATSGRSSPNSSIPTHGGLPSIRPAARNFANVYVYWECH